MNLKKLIIYDYIELFKILHEIKKELCKIILFFADVCSSDGTLTLINSNPSIFSLCIILNLNFFFLYQLNLIIHLAFPLNLK